MLFFGNLFQIVEHIIIGCFDLLTEFFTYTIHYARQLALQLDVTTKTRYWPWVVLQLIEVGDCSLHLHRNEWEVILVVIQELEELLVCIKLVVSKLCHFFALIYEHLCFILGSDDEVEELQRVTLVKP